MRRMFRGTAFLVVGLVILVGVAVMYFGFREDVKFLQETEAEA